MLLSSVNHNMIWVFRPVHTSIVELSTPITSRKHHRFVICLAHMTAHNPAHVIGTLPLACVDTVVTGQLMILLQWVTCSCLYTYLAGIVCGKYKCSNWKDMYGSHWTVSWLSTGTGALPNITGILKGKLHENVCMYLISRPYIRWLLLHVTKQQHCHVCCTKNLTSYIISTWWQIDKTDLNFTNYRQQFVWSAWYYYSNPNKTMFQVKDKCIQ